MTRIPISAAIDAAELRLAQSKQNVRQSVVRTRSAMRAAVARPSTVVLVAVVSGIAAFLVSHRRRSAVNSVPNSADSTFRASSRSLGRTLAAIFAAQALTFALQVGAAAWKQGGARVNANRRSASTEGDSTLLSATTEHDSSGPVRHGVG